jgi:hypothetical protein
MKKLGVIFFKRLFIQPCIYLLSVGLFFTPQSWVWSQSKGGGLSPFTLEFTPGLGVNLPYDIWGTPGTMDVFSLRTAYSVNPGGNLELGFLYHQASEDNAYTLDLGYRVDIPSDVFLAFFNVGYHISQFNLEPDFDENGDCVPSNCLTDSGIHHGLNFGGGIFIPITQTRALRLAMRFYKNPITWLLIEAGVGFRF